MSDTNTVDPGSLNTPLDKPSPLYENLKHQISAIIDNTEKV